MERLSVSGYAQANVEIAPRRVRIGANDVGGLHQLLRLCLVDARKSN